MRWTLEWLARRPGLAAEAVRRIAGSTRRTTDGGDPARGAVVAFPAHPGLLGSSSSPAISDGPAGRRWGPGRSGSRVGARRRIELAANRAFHRPGPFVERPIYTFTPRSEPAPALLLSGAVDFTLVRLP